MAARLILAIFALITSVLAGTVTGNAVIAGMNGQGQGYSLPTIGDERTMLVGFQQDQALAEAEAARLAEVESRAMAAPAVLPVDPQGGARMTLASAHEDMACIDCEGIDENGHWITADRDDRDIREDEMCVPDDFTGRCMDPRDAAGPADRG